MLPLMLPNMLLSCPSMFAVLLHLTVLTKLIYSSFFTMFPSNSPSPSMPSMTLTNLLCWRLVLLVS